MCRRTTHTARMPSSSLTAVTVTHPFHPFKGHRLEVREERRRPAHQLICAGPRLGNVSLPADFTDRVPTLGDGLLNAEVLADLAAVLRTVEQGLTALGRGNV